MRWSLVDLFVFVLLVGLALGVYQAFWGPMWLNARIVLAANLALLTTMSLGAWYSAGPWRRVCLAYSIFGWSYFAIFLRFGFGFDPDVTAGNLIRYSILGALMSLICSLTAYLFLRGTARKTNGQGQPNGASQSGAVPNKGG